MNLQPRIALFSVLMIIMLVPGLAQAQDGPAKSASPRKKFSVLGLIPPSDKPCRPVYLKAVSIGTRPPGVLTGHVTLESYSAKPIIAVKLKWEVYRWDVGTKKRRSNCDGTKGDEVFLSGTTPLIDIGQLAAKETCNLTVSTFPTMWPATRTVVIEQPIISWTQVKSLAVDGTSTGLKDDGTPVSFKDDYVILVYVSEIHFTDGSTWTEELN